MAIVFVGIDLAKNVFAVHGVDEHDKPALVRSSVPRARLHALIASLPACTIGMEACSGAGRTAWAGYVGIVDLVASENVTGFNGQDDRTYRDLRDSDKCNRT